ncbi:MAG: carbamoylsarcosine amidase [Gemmatimonadetes bacterium]|jgi:N-carbamoylsarcosine amidase|nr:carbamoylsarcosine amidase [Gemmatimonadota bacterium]
MDSSHVTAAIQSVRDHYEERGIFMKQFGFGRKPALVVIDMAYGWTDPAYATGSTRLDEAVAGIKQLLPRCRRKQVPIVYTTSPFRQEDEEPMHSRDSSQADGSSYLPWDERACEIDERLKPEPGDFVIYKENASAFFGTHLAAHLVDNRVDTVIVTGCSTSACVRATATDARAYRFRAIVPRQCVQDRAPAAHEWNLFDLDAKFADVVDVDEVAEYLEQLS